MRHRRRVARGVLAAAAGLFALGALAACGHGREDERPPSVVLFLVDTLRADHLGCYGYERPTSPRTDAFAAEAVLFERCFAQSTWTKPATASILTGRYPSEHAAEHFASVLSPHHATLAEHAREAGLRTAAFGRNAFVFAPPFGFDRGFEVFRSSDAAPSEPEARADAVVDEALAWLDEIGPDEPFLLYLHVVDPHGPYDPPSPFRERFDRGYEGDVDGSIGVDDPEKPLHDLGPADVEHLIDLYDGEIAAADHAFGRLLDGLEERGRSDDALVLFVSDHGEEFRDHGGWGHGPRFFDEHVRVPLVVRFPGRPRALAGVRVESLVRQIDLLPTVLDVLGADAQEGLPGRSLLPLALGADEPERVGIGEVRDGGVVRRAVQRGSLKFVRTTLPAAGEELYDVERDPAERRDLVADAAEAAAELRRLLDAHEAATSSGEWIALLENGGEEPLEAVIAVSGSRPLERVSAHALEEPHSAGSVPDVLLPPEEMGTPFGPRTVWRAHLHVEPGDRDGLRVLPAPGEERIDLLVQIDGRPADPARVLLGPDELPGDSMPLVVELSRAAELESSRRPGGDGPPVRPFAVRVWKTPEATRASAEVGPELRAALRALGYAEAED